MKTSHRCFSILVMTVLLSVLALGSCFAADNGLMAQFKLSGDCYDASGNGNNGTAVGDVSFVDDPVVGNCAVFNGGYINIPSSPGLNPGGNFTISAWVLVDPVEGPKVNGSIVSQLDSDGTYNVYHAYAQGTYGVRMDTRYSKAGERSVLGGGFDDYTLSARWTNVLFCYDGQTLYMYVNGTLEGSCDIPGDSIMPSSNKMRIGTGNDINNKSLFFRGKMADVRLYNKALSFAEIKALNSAGANAGTTSSAGSDSGSNTNGGTNPTVTPPATTTPTHVVVPSDPNTVNVVINGQPLVSDVKPIVNEDGRTMLPVGAIASALGAQVQWDPATQTATLTRGTIIIKISIGQNVINVNGSQVSMDTAAVINNGRTLLPVGAVGKALGAEIGWDAGTKTVSISAPLTVLPFIDLSSWTGTWTTNWGKMVLTQSGNLVSGNYEYDSGKITGTVVDGILSGTWSESPSYSPPGDAGDIIFTMNSDGKSFSGQWRYGSEGSYSTWTGTRDTAVADSTDPSAYTEIAHQDKGEGRTKTSEQERDYRGE
ncbi:MAG: stalk domain-containing protein [Syntrophomonadaceae bacterium]